jgi:hypothetical protein
VVRSTVGGIKIPSSTQRAYVGFKDVIETLSRAHQSDQRHWFRLYIHDDVFFFSRTPSPHSLDNYHTSSFDNFSQRWPLSTKRLTFSKRVRHVFVSSICASIDDDSHKTDLLLVSLNSSCDDKDGSNGGSNNGDTGDGTVVSFEIFAAIRDGSEVKGVWTLYDDMDSGMVADCLSAVSTR